MILAFLLAQALPVAPPAPPPPVVILPSTMLAETVVESRSGKLNLQLVAFGERLVLTVSDDKGFLGRLPIETPNDALAILADSEMERLWGPLLDRAGADLVKLRDGMLARAEQGWRQGLAFRRSRNAVESLSVDQGVHSLLIYAQALNSAGREDQAIGLLRQWLAESAGAADTYDVTLVAMRLAAIHSSRGDLDATLAALMAGRAAVARDKDYRVNIDINRAAFLAEGRRYAEALNVHDQALKDFGKSGLNLAGSLLQFAWIRACALKGLGRPDEAERAMASTRESADVLFHRGAILPPSAEVRLRGYLCLGDKDGLVRELAANAAQDYALNGWLLLLQHGRRHPRQQELWQAVRADPRVVQAYAGRLRQLPPELIPALNRWRVDGKTVAP